LDDRDADAARRPRAAVFLDRDGTVIDDAHYLSRPNQVRLISGAANAISRLNAASVPVVVISNQSGVGRGFFSHNEMLAVQRRVEKLLAERGARLDSAYFCPHAPGADGEPVCACRKPGTELYHRAARDLGLDLRASWYIGDRWRDVAPADALGGSGLLISAASTPADELSRARNRTALSLGAAVDAILARV